MKTLKPQNKSLIALGALGLAAVTSFGTVAVAGPGKDGAKHGQHRGDRMQKMADKLNLTDAQKAKIKPIMENAMQQMKALRDNDKLTREQKRDKMRAIHQATQAKINPILTAAQRQQLAQMKAQRGEHRGQKHDKK